MRVRLAREAMDCPDEWMRLNRMVMLCENSRHEWLADNPEEIHGSSWCRQQINSPAGDFNTKVLQEHIRWAAYPKDRHEITVCLKSTSTTELSPADALARSSAARYSVSS